MFVSLSPDAIDDTSPLHAMRKQECSSAMALLLTNMGSMAIAVHRDRTARWGPKRRAQAAPAWKSVELVLCIMMGLIQPARMLWDGGVMEKQLPAFRWAAGILSALAWIALHQPVLAARGRVGHNTFVMIVLPLTWFMALAISFWAMHAAITVTNVVSGGSWRADSLAEFVCAILQMGVVIVLSTIAVSHPPVRVLDYRARAKRARSLVRERLRSRSAALYPDDDEAAVSSSTCKTIR